MDNILDIFNNDAFSVTSLSLALKELPPVSTRLGDMGLFQVISVPTTSVAIERIGETLQIVPPSPRGGPGETRDYAKRSMQDVRIPHFQRDWSVMADEVQDVRKFGGMALQLVQDKVAEKLAVHTADFDATDELSRIGAIQGVVTYKDNSTLDLFTTFGVPAPVEVDFDLDNAAPTDGSLRKSCTNIVRSMRTAMGGNPFSYVHAFVGDNFFDDLLQHPEVRETYKGWSEAQILRESYVGKNRAENPIFEFGGIVWENYYGATGATGDAALLGIQSEKARFIPVGSRGTFVSFFGPADYVDTVNLVGLQRYARQWTMPNGKGINGETQTNALHICTRPGVLLSARRT